MKTVGIIGGIGPESTIDYYRSILATYRERTGSDSAPSIVINSVDLQKLVGLFEANELNQATEYLGAEVQRLARAGADFGVLSANTPHLVFDEVQRRSPIPLISIVEATCAAAKDMGLRKVGLLGTRFTMQARFFPDVFARAGVALVVPEPEEHNEIHEIYMGELVKGIFRPEARERLLAIADGLRERHAIQGLILGGTELPLILRESSYHGIPFLDTTKIHVNSIVARLLA